MAAACAALSNQQGYGAAGAAMPYLGTLQPQGGTNMKAAFENAFDVMARSSTVGTNSAGCNKIFLFLSDGSELVCTIHAPEVSFKEHCMTAINLYMLRKFEDGWKHPVKLARQAQAIAS